MGGGGACPVHLNAPILQIISVVFVNSIVNICLVLADILYVASFIRVCFLVEALILLLHRQKPPHINEGEATVPHDAEKYDS